MSERGKVGKREAKKEGNKKKKKKERRKKIFAYYCGSFI